MENKELKGVRERFFEGELPESNANSKARKARRSSEYPLTIEARMNRIDPRLQNVIVRACNNSEPASRVVDMFEKFVVASFGGEKAELTDSWWKDILLVRPNIAESEKSSHVTVKFFFEAISSKGGFHRLLLHAITQFHGLRAVSSILKVEIGEASSARALAVTGSIDKTSRCSLYDHLTQTN